VIIKRVGTEIKFPFAIQTLAVLNPPDYFEFFDGVCAFGGSFAGTATVIIYSGLIKVGSVPLSLVFWIFGTILPTIIAYLIGVIGVVLFVAFAFLVGVVGTILSVAFRIFGTILLVFFAFLIEIFGTILFLAFVHLINICGVVFPATFACLISVGNAILPAIIARTAPTLTPQAIRSACIFAKLR